MKTKWNRALLIAGLAATIVMLPGAVTAQVQTTTQTATSGAPTHEQTVQRGEVVLVDGNDLIVKMEDGSLRHLKDIPDSVKVDVDGKELGVHELKPGMKLEHTITTSTTPKVITTTQTVTGTVFHVSPPSSVILRMENGENQSFQVPKGQKFTINGQETDVWSLKKGMKVSATKVVEEPITVAEQQRKITGQMPPPPDPPPANMPILVAVIAPAHAPAPTLAEQKRPDKLPQTGSRLPALFVCGLAIIAASACIRLWRAS